MVHSGYRSPPSLYRYLLAFFNVFIMMTGQIARLMVLTLSRQYTQPLLDPSRQKLDLRRLAASDLAQVVLSKVV